MFLFGHIGITLGTAVLLEGIRQTIVSPKLMNEVMESSECSSPVSLTSDCPAGCRASWVSSLGKYIDIRFLLVGALLPDIIDKPVGQYFFRQTFSNGRIFSHTLLFLLLIALSGWFLYQRRRQIWLLIFAFGTFTHLIFDRMWESPQTLLWPLRGSAFSEEVLTGWLSNMINNLFTDPAVYGPEMVGAAVIAWFMGILLRRRKVFIFIRYGRVD